MYGKMQALGLTEFIPFIGTSPSGANPIPLFTLFLASSQLLITLGDGGIFWITVLGAFIHIWRPEITDGCDIS